MANTKANHLPDAPYVEWGRADGRFRLWETRKSVVAIRHKYTPYDKNARVTSREFRRTIPGMEPEPIGSDGNTRWIDQYSDRAKAIVFVARYRSGKDGASAIDTDHFIEAIVFLDQGKLAEAVDSDSLLSPVFEPTHFFPPEVASEILLKIQHLFPHREPIPESVDMPVTADLQRTFAAASTLIAELNHKQVEPLHLLAAALSEHSEAAKLLATFGITRDHVITTLSCASKER